MYSGDAAVVLPTLSVSFAVRVYVPSGSGVVGSRDQVPSACTFAVPITLSPL